MSFDKEVKLTSDHDRPFIRADQHVGTTELKWHRRFLGQAGYIATWSKDPSTQTGCVLVKDRAIISTGYNGFPRGVADFEERYENRTLKYLLVVHCDTNAIYNAARRGVSTDGTTMYLTGPPCNECMKGIIQAGIVLVVWPRDNKFETDEDTWRRWFDATQAAELMALESGVDFLRVDV